MKQDDTVYTVLVIRAVLWVLGILILARFAWRDGPIILLLILESVAAMFWVSCYESKLIQLRRQLEITKEARDAAIQAADTDSLTGLLNRRGARKEAERLLRIHNRRGFTPPFADSNVTPTSQSVAVVYLDLDNFKGVNDVLGHRTGDSILQLAAEVIRRFFARPTDIICRQGGDEFVVILTENAKVEAVVDQLRKLQGVFVAESRELFRLNNHHQKADPRIAVTVSCGVIAVSVSREAVIDFDSLIKQADDLMYQAKQMGKNQVVVG